MVTTIADISDEEIVRRCYDDENPDHFGRRFQQISDDVIVKFGWSVTEDVAENQEYARILSSETNIRVPKVHRYFSRSGLGFIVMEFVHGDPLEKVSF